VLAYNAIPSATSSVHVTGSPPEELEEELLDELLEEDEELEEELDEDEELEAPLEDEDEDDDAPPELLLEEELPGVTPPLVQPCRATAPAANKMSAIFFI
jgi:hypothetical protein